MKYRIICIQITSNYIIMFNLAKRIFTLSILTICCLGLTFSLNAQCDVFTGGSGSITSGGSGGPAQHTVSVSMNASCGSCSTIEYMAVAVCVGGNCSTGTTYSSGASTSGNHSISINGEGTWEIRPCWRNGPSSPWCGENGIGTVTVTPQGCNFGVTTPANTSASAGSSVTISATPSGSGVAPYTYSFSGGGSPATQSSASSSFTTTYATAGNYTVSVSVTDANGCTASDNTTVTVTDGCNASAGWGITNRSADTGATINYTGPSFSGFNYSWSAGSGSPASGSSQNFSTSFGTAGSYTVCLTVTDQNDPTCTHTNCGSVTVSDPVAGCPATGDYTVSGGPAGGNGCPSTQYAFSTTPGPSGTTYSWTAGSGSFVGPSSGSSVNVSFPDVTGAYTASVCVTVTEPGCPGVTDCKSINIADSCGGGGGGCAGSTLSVTATGSWVCPDDTGSVSASSTGGVGSVTYAWSSGATSGLSAGSYTVTATDSNGCTATATATVVDEGCGGGGGSCIANINSVIPSDASCGLSDGSVQVSANGLGILFGFSLYDGDPNNPSGCGFFQPCTAIQTNTTGNNTVTFNNLAAGTYWVRASYGSGTESCQDTETFTIEENCCALTVEANGSYDCTTLGTATATTSNATGTVTYSWSNGASGATATGLALGTYTVSATDDNCTQTTTVTISEPAGGCGSCTLTVNTSGSYDCNSAQGQATASSANASVAATYAWSNGGTGNTITGLALGTYTVTITDGSCTATSSVTITEPAGGCAGSCSLEVSATSSWDCNTGTGSATATVTGATGTVTYAWSNGDTGATITGLAAGAYTVTATDDNCSVTTKVSVAEPSGGCGGCAMTLSITGDYNCERDAGTATVTPSNTTGTVSYLWSNGATTASITGLSTGAYAVTVTDDNCSQVTAVMITEPVGGCIDNTCPYDVDAFATFDCRTNTGTAGVIVSKAIYSWSTGATTSSITGLAAGTYTVTITADGCTVIHSITVSPENNGVFAEIIGSNTGNGFETQTYVTPVVDGATYAWSVDGGVGSSTTNAIDVYWTSTGTKRLCVTVTSADGCTASDCIEIIIATLPVEFTSFNGTAQGRNVRLDWATASETNNSYFSIEHSTDGIDFRSVGSVRGNGTTVNPQYYEFLHDQAIIGNNFYRLKQVDFDGTYQYSKVITVSFNKQVGHKLKVYPNPISANNAFNIKLESSADSGDAQVIIYDMYGQQLYTEAINVIEGLNEMRLDANQFPSGVLIVNVQFENGKTISQKLLIQK